MSLDDIKFATFESLDDWMNSQGHFITNGAFIGHAESAKEKPLCIVFNETPRKTQGKMLPLGPVFSFVRNSCGKMHSHSSSGKTYCKS